VTAQELSAYLRAHIPLTRALELEVIEVSDAVVRLRAPLAPNVNHRQTAFGGSVACLAILSAWGWLHARLAGTAADSRLVIQHQAMEYLAPIAGPFTASCTAPPPEAWRRFSRAFASRRRGRIELAAEVTCGDSVAAKFTGTYVALPGASSISA
jgi:thioesterase domain-containing protein